MGHEYGTVGMSGDLGIQVHRAPRRRGFTLPLPFDSRLHFTFERHGALWAPGGLKMGSDLEARLFRGGRLKEVIPLGSGLVTNVGVLAMANDFAWAQNAQTLKLANFHATGTGTTSAAATDIALQTSAGPSPATGTQSLVSAANLQIYRTVATLNYTGTLAITEWGLFTAATLSATTGSPFTATSATTGTATGTPFTASSSSVQGEQQLIVVPGTTTVWGLVLSNTTSVLTIPAWYKVADGTAGSTPGATETYALKPVMWDHKVFSAINVVNGDAIQFTYSLTIASGG